MEVPEQRSKARQLKELHRPGDPLVLINAWDAASARIVESVGYPAVATTSAGVAWARGFADGQKISREEMLEHVAVIARAVHVPVTADLEAGYGSTVEEARRTARGAIEAGAVGLNFEDSRDGERQLIDAALQAQRIEAIREVATAAGVPLVINARTDCFLAGVGGDDGFRLEESIRRGKLYTKAGADCVFVPGVADEKTIAALVAGLQAPLNILASAKAPSLERLARLGVARVSLGSGSIGFALAKLRELATGLQAGEGFDLLRERLSHADLNALFE
jgi:2-methylisocitrate lyase-like PEP mutase family enzyme